MSILILRKDVRVEIPVKATRRSIETPNEWFCTQLDSVTKRQNKNRDRNTQWFCTQQFHRLLNGFRNKKRDRNTQLIAHSPHFCFKVTFKIAFNSRNIKTIYDNYFMFLEENLWISCLIKAIGTIVYANKIVPSTLKGSLVSSLLIKPLGRSSHWIVVLSWRIFEACSFGQWPNKHTFFLHGTPLKEGGV